MRAALTLALALGAVVLPAPAAQADFGFEEFSAAAVKPDGSVAEQAGSHPYALDLAVHLNEAPETPSEPGVRYPEGDLKNLRYELPSGLIGNPTVLGHCTLTEFDSPRRSPFEESDSGESCPDNSQAGVITLHTSLGTRSFGLFNVTPPPGVAAELAASPYGEPVVFLARVRDVEGEYGLTMEARNFPQTLALGGADVSVWGTPWAVSHDTQRGDCLNEADPAEPWGKCSVGPAKINRPRAFLTLPTRCAGPLRYEAFADSWEAPGVEARATTQSVDGEGDPAGLTGCNLLDFQSLSYAQPTTVRAGSPAGFEFILELPQEGLTEPSRLAPSQIRNATVALPEGMTINPSVGAGLGVCTPAQYAAETVTSAPGAGCPNESRIGDFRLESPLTEEAVNGGIFLAEPFHNPFGSLIAVYLIARAPKSGIIARVAGKLEPDRATGTITASFTDLPQLPYSHLRLFFREGQRSPLASPSSCGTYGVGIALNPWLDPELVLHRTSEFTLSQGPGGTACPPSGALPFAPAGLSGSVNANAGSYSPYYLHLTRSDTEQEITSYSATLPPGLTGKLTGVATCSDQALAAAAANSGVAEREHPSCPAGSEVGHTVAGFGLGGVLDYAPGRLYLAGPYRGAPLSLAAVDSILVGPFDLGVIVVRSAIRIDPRSAQVSIDTAGEHPFPHIIDGIPLHLRDLRVYISRPGFTLNPTSCEPFATASTLVGAGSRLGDESDDVPVAVPGRYQATNCSALRFRPRLTMKLKGPSRRGAFPQLRAEVRERGGDANIASAVVTLPRAEFLAEEHLEDFCSLTQFRAQNCPAGSVYGHARAFTPLLPAPLEGPVYLRVSEDAAAHPLPDLVASLHGDGGIAIDVVGHVSSHNGGMRASFEGLPDAPASRFVFSLDGGRNGLLQNTQNLCTEPAAATARMAGQNNRGASLRVPLEAECGKKGHRRGGHRHRGAHR